MCFILKFSILPDAHTAISWRYMWAASWYNLPSACCKNKDAAQQCDKRATDQRLFPLYFLNIVFQDSSHFLWLKSLTFVRTPKTGFVVTVHMLIKGMYHVDQILIRKVEWWAAIPSFFEDISASMQQNIFKSWFPVIFFSHNKGKRYSYNKIMPKLQSA